MKILLAEDNPGSRQSIKTFLSAAGYEVVEARDGQEAWELFQREPFQMIVTDWAMPRLDGPGLTRNVRASQKRHTYIIMLTAADKKSKAVMELEDGADEYLTRPVNSRELVTCVASGKRILRLEEQLTEARQQVEVLAMRDSLTGLLNRGAIEEHAEAEFKMAVRKERPMSAILLDVDHFKEVNDRFGRAVGDQTLRQVAKILKENLRGYDRIGRWGGDEFMLILPDTELNGAALAAERIRDQTAETKIPLENGETFSVRVSLGVASTVSGFSSLTKLIEATGQALAKAKQTGQNRVCTFGLEP